MTIQSLSSLPSLVPSLECSFPNKTPVDDPSSQWSPLELRVRKEVIILAYFLLMMMIYTRLSPLARSNAIFCPLFLSIYVVIMSLSSKSISNVNIVIFEETKQPDHSISSAEIA